MKFLRIGKVGQEIPVVLDKDRTEKIFKRLFNHFYCRNISSNEKHGLE